MAQTPRTCPGVSGIPNGMRAQVRRWTDTAGLEASEPHLPSPPPPHSTTTSLPSFPPSLPPPPPPPSHPPLALLLPSPSTHTLTHSLTHSRQARRDAKHCTVRTLAPACTQCWLASRVAARHSFTSFVCAVRSVRNGLSSTSLVAPFSQAANAQDAAFMIFHVLSVEYPNQVFYTCRGGYSLDRKLGDATNVSSTACLHTGRIFPVLENPFVIAMSISMVSSVSGEVAHYVCRHGHTIDWTRGCRIHFLLGDTPTVFTCMPGYSTEAKTSSLLVPNASVARQCRSNPKTTSSQTEKSLLLVPNAYAVSVSSDIRVLVTECDPSAPNRRALKGVRASCLISTSLFLPRAISTSNLTRSLDIPDTISSLRSGTSLFCCCSHS